VGLTLGEASSRALQADLYLLGEPADTPVNVEGVLGEAKIERRG
jgi:hypothetical protein